ncbi:AEC family transporter [Paenibacillus sp. GCM10023248]|uniref:AEC family transporter n=1 Tax=Bacillales TaxID=1385 RepID=UPI00237953D0|nr:MULTISPECIES: AEC family transporter [Bacillales]MDD9269416.1 AEC family transporter [Paenibacillus sp. MAHUQ-63]MDR6880963.1 putative permease [Bacillus sp. 3255]
MDILFLILLNVIVPVFLLIGAGVLMHRVFHFEMNTLSKLNAYFLLPAVSFTNIYESKFEAALLFQIVGFLLLQSAMLILMSKMTAKLANFDKGLSSSFANSVVLSNSGNFGLPVSQLVFHNSPLGLSVQIVVSIYQNMLTNTYGLMNAASAQSQGQKLLKELMRNPMIYAFILGMVMHALAVPIPGFIWNPLQNVANAFLAIALVTLGAQSAYMQFKHFSPALLFSLLGRLIVSPVIALGFIWLLQLEGPAAQALFIASSFPTSRNSAAFALEYGNHPEYAAQAVLLSTLLSSVTVTGVVFMAKILF